MTEPVVGRLQVCISASGAIAGQLHTGVALFTATRSTVREVLGALAAEVEQAQAPGGRLSAGLMSGVPKLAWPASGQRVGEWNIVPTRSGELAAVSLATKSRLGGLDAKKSLADVCLGLQEAYGTRPVPLQPFGPKRHTAAGLRTVAL